MKHPRQTRTYCHHGPCGVAMIPLPERGQTQDWRIWYNIRTPVSALETRDMFDYVCGHVSPPLPPPCD